MCDELAEALQKIQGETAARIDAPEQLRHADRLRTVGIRREYARSPKGYEEYKGQCLCIYVLDEGEGVSEKNRQHIFDPFFTTKEVGEGTGLGLSIAHGIVHEHGGWIGVTRKHGKGSCFSIYLPPGGLINVRTDPGC